MSAPLTLRQKSRVVLADDHPAMLKAVTDILTPQFEVVAAVNDGREALQAVAQTNPDLLISDIAMPGLDGIRTAQELRQNGHRPKVVFLTGLDDDDCVSEALRVGATGYVVKRRMQPDLILALNCAVTGQYFISPHGFTGTSRSDGDRHILGFYLDENSFFEKVSEIVHAALVKEEQLFLFLSKMRLHFIGQRLSARGMDVSRAISCSQLHVCSIENVLPLLMRDSALKGGDFYPIGFNKPIGLDSSPRWDCFEAFFCPIWKQATARSREHGSKVTIISDMLAVALREGYGHQFTSRLEAVWNDLIPRDACTVLCGCPLMQLSSKEDRETLAGICSRHSKVIPIHG